MHKEEKPKRHEGWKVIEKKTFHNPDGQDIDRYVRVRTMGVLKKVASAFVDEMGKIADDDDESMKGPAPTEEAVLKFIKKNPRPTDKAFHEWAESHGYNVHKAEAATYGILSDILHKGKSKGKHPAGIPESEVRQGVEVEAEHTPNPIIRRKINDDHHAELGKGYYPALMKLEKGMKKKASEGDWINPKIQGEARELLLKGSKSKTMAEAESVANELYHKGHFGKDPNNPRTKHIWAKVQAALAHSRKLEKEKK